MHYLYHKEEFVPSQGYVKLPPRLITKEEFNRLTNNGREIYQNEWFVACDKDGNPLDP